MQNTGHLFIERMPKLLSIKTQHLPGVNSGLLMLILFLSIWRPVALFPFFTLSMVPITLLTILLALLWKIHHGPGFVWVWQKYRTEILLFLLYQVALLVSVGLNLNNYESFSHVVRYGIDPVAVFTAFPMLLLLFTLPKKHVVPAGEKHVITRAFVWLFFVLVAMLGIFQYLDYEQSTKITRHFIAAEYPVSVNVSSVFRIRTDFGPIMALAALCLMTYLRFSSNVNNVNLHSKLMIAAMIVLFVIAGLASGSRNFLLTFIVGVMFLLVHVFKKRPILTIVSLLSLILLSHAIILSNLGATTKYGAIFPYLKKFGTHQSVELRDLVPVVNEEGLGGRLVLWKAAVKSWEENPFIGISGGSFRLARSINSDHVVNQIGGNTHNLLLQSVVDAGVVGLILTVLILFFLIKRLEKAQIPIAAAALASLMFDYYLDHSLPWMVCMVWFICSVKTEKYLTAN